MKGIRGFLCTLAVLVIASAPNFASAATSTKTSGYILGTGDQLRVTVFDEADLSGQFEVDGSGNISMPLIGQVEAGGLSLPELEERIKLKLLDGYLKKPQISIEVMNYRPFYILGEVNNPGSYPYVSGMTVLNAIALAGGYTYRAKTDKLFLTRDSDPAETKREVTEDTVVMPGDIIRVMERFF